MCMAANEAAFAAHVLLRVQRHAVFEHRLKRAQFTAIGLAHVAGVVAGSSTLSPLQARQAERHIRSLVESRLPERISGTLDDANSVLRLLRLQELMSSSAAQRVASSRLVRRRSVAARLDRRRRNQ